MISSSRLFNRIGRNCRGTSAIEFALLAPVLAAMTVGIVDLANGLARKYYLEQASYRVLELMTAGSLRTDYEDYAGDEVAAILGDDADDVTVTVTPRLYCDDEEKSFSREYCTDVELPIPANTDPDEGVKVERYVTVTLVQDFSPQFAYIADLIGGDDGKVTLTARSTLRVK